MDHIDRPLPPIETRWKPGQSGNPGGKPSGARNTITKKFLNALLKDFESNGERAIEAARKKDPLGYVKVVASLIPKQVEPVKALETMSDDELLAGINFLREQLADRADEGSRDAEASITSQELRSLS